MEVVEKASLADRRANALAGEVEEARSLLDSAERGKKQCEAELAESREACNEMTSINSKAASDKRAIEGVVHTMHAEIDDTLMQAKNAEEKASPAEVWTKALDAGGLSLARSVSLVVATASW